MQLSSIFFLPQKNHLKIGILIFCGNSTSRCATFYWQSSFFGDLFKRMHPGDEVWRLCSSGSFCVVNFKHLEFVWHRTHRPKESRLTFRFRFQYLPNQPSKQKLYNFLVLIISSQPQQKLAKRHKQTKPGDSSPDPTNDSTGVWEVPFPTKPFDFGVKHD